MYKSGRNRLVEMGMNNISSEVRKAKRMHREVVELVREAKELVENSRKRRRT